MKYLIILLLLIVLGCEKEVPILDQNYYGARNSKNVVILEDVPEVNIIEEKSIEKDIIEYKNMELKDFPSSVDFIKILRILSKKDYVDEDIIDELIEAMGISSPSETSIFMRNDRCIYKLKWEKYDKLKGEFSYWISMDLKYSLDGEFYRDRCSYSNQ